MKINVKVFPKSSRVCVVETEEVLKVYLKAAPDKGKANRELIGLLADHFGRKKSQIRILTGITSRNKIVEVNGDG